MRDALHGSKVKTAVSIVTALLACVTGMTSVAGDKIQFTVPDNAALAQKPEREAKPDDTQGADKFGAGVPSAPTMEMTQPMESMTVVVETGAKDRHGRDRDRDKHNGLRAWDSGMKPTDLQEEDESQAADAKPASNGLLTNNYDVKTDWDKTSESSNPNRFDGFVKAAAQHSQDRNQNQGQNGGGNNNEMSASFHNDAGSFTGFGPHDAAAQENADKDKPSDTDGLSAWGKTFSSSKGSYSERFEEYRAMYDTPSMNVDGSDRKPSAGGDPEESAFANGAPDASSLSARSAPSAFDSYNSESSSGALSQYGGADLGTISATSAPARAPSFDSTSGSGQGFSQPAVLSFPKQPGSIFR